MRYLLILLTLVCAVFYSCKDDECPAVTKSVYVVGFENNGSAKLWKDGVVSNLTDGTKAAFAQSVYVANNDVYVAGDERENGKLVAKYWVNNEEVKLTDGQKYSRAYSIAKSGSDVHVAGFEDNGSHVVAKYWRNGTSIPLTDGSKTSTAHCVAISGSDVYILGYEAGYVKFWKNGIEKVFDSSYQVLVNSMTVDNTTVYLAGESLGNGLIDRATYWVNDSAIYLTDGKYYSQANGIFVQSGNVYVAGAEHNGTKWVAKYWKNGVEIPLTDGQNGAFGQSIFVDGSDVYVAGYQKSENENVHAMYWVNGTPVMLSDSNAYEYAMSIYVY